MAAGTITLTNNSDAVAGAGTAFLTDLAAGDFIVANVGGIAYTLPVRAVASATSLTIISKFTGPTLSGLAWFVAKRDQQALIPAALGIQNAEALRLLNNDKSNWQAVFSAAGDITVTLPDNSQFTGPSWQKIVTLLAASDIEAIQPLADQVRADALQVAADKTAAETAKTDAVAAKDAAQAAASTASTAKTDAVAAKDAAVSAAGASTSQATASEASAKRAEAAAGSLDGSIYLQKSDNLNSVTNKETARTNLQLDRLSQKATGTVLYSAGGVHAFYIQDSGRWGAFNESTQKWDPLAIASGGTGAATPEEALTNLGAVSKAELSARIGYSLISLPAGTISLGARSVLTNPFGVNVPVICKVELLHPGLSQWVSGAWINANGCNALYVEGEGIILRTGATSFLATAVQSGASREFSVAITSSVAARIHVWKVAS